MGVHHERFEFVDPDNNHYKFWEYTYSDTDRQLVVRWGRIGTRGQSKIFEGVMPTEIDERVEDKLRKGYKKIPMGPSSAPARSVPEPDPSHDPAYSLAKRMEAVAEDRDYGPARFTLVQSYEYVAWGFTEYYGTVEIAKIPTTSMIELIETVDGFVGSWTQAYHMMELLNSVPVEDGEPGHYPGVFSTINIDGAGVAIG